MIAIIAALSKNNVIGLKNGIPWDLPDDRERFRSLTWGHTLVMGRDTYESIGRPLPGRRTIVLTRSLSAIPGVDVAPSLGEALRMAAKDDIFICGGAKVYAEAMLLADRLYLTLVQAEVQGDTFFPPIPVVYQEIERHEVSQPLPHDFVVLARLAS